MSDFGGEAYEYPGYIEWTVPLINAITDEQIICKVTIEAPDPFAALSAVQIAATQITAAAEKAMEVRDAALHGGDVREVLAALGLCDEHLDEMIDKLPEELQQAIRGDGPGDVGTNMDRILADRAPDAMGDEAERFLKELNGL